MSEPAALALAQLEDELTELAAEINARTCRRLELVAEFDRRGGWDSRDFAPAPTGSPGAAPSPRARRASSCGSRTRSLRFP